MPGRMRHGRHSERRPVPMGGMTRGGQAPVTGSPPPQRREQILLAVVAAALVIVAVDGWIFLHYGANAATKQYPDNYLTAIACPNATQCWAVGQTASAPGGNTLSESRGPLLKLETAGHWRTVAALGREVRRGPLEAIACPGAGDCWAVGGTSARGPALIEHWTGGTWQPVPSPALPGAQLDAVSCASASACWAIGGTQSRTGAADDVLEQWNGAQWSLAATLPGGLQPREISCPVAGHCLALGLRGGAAAAARYSGGRWTPAPAPAGPTGPNAGVVRLRRAGYVPGRVPRPESRDRRMERPGLDAGQHQPARLPRRPDLLRRRRLLAAGHDGQVPPAGPALAGRRLGPGHRARTPSPWLPRRAGVRRPVLGGRRHRRRPRERRPLHPPPHRAPPLTPPRPPVMGARSPTRAGCGIKACQTGCSRMARRVQG